MDVRKVQAGWAVYVAGAPVIYAVVPEGGFGRGQTPPVLADW